jgi:hypothetical protein
MDDSDASALVQAALQHDDEAARALVRQLRSRGPSNSRSTTPFQSRDLSAVAAASAISRVATIGIGRSAWTESLLIPSCLISESESKKFSKNETGRSSNRFMASIFFRRSSCACSPAITLFPHSDPRQRCSTQQRIARRSRRSPSQSLCPLDLA